MSVAGGRGTGTRSVLSVTCRGGQGQGRLQRRLRGPQARREGRPRKGQPWPGEGLRGRSCVTLSALLPRPRDTDQPSSPGESAGHPPERWFYKRRRPRPPCLSPLPGSLGRAPPPLSRSRPTPRWPRSPGHPRPCVLRGQRSVSALPPFPTWRKPFPLSSQTPSKCQTQKQENRRVGKWATAPSQTLRRPK